MSARAVFALRAVAVTTVAALLLNVPLGCTQPLAPWVVLDASESWLASGGSSAWDSARAVADSAMRAGGDSLLLLGDSVRGGPPPERPEDGATRAGPLVDAARARGRPVVLITDGRLEDPDRLTDLPRGSEVRVVSGLAVPDAGLAAIDAPEAALAGDTVSVRVLVRAGGAGAPARELRLVVGGVRLAAVTLPALPAFGEHEARSSVVVPRVDGRVELVAALSPSDAVPPNDTARRELFVTGAAAAVLVSTSPDQDARFALAVLRGTRRGAIRGYWRVAPGVWRTDDGLRPVDESTIRRAIGAAALVVLHGDTSYFGPPRARAQGALVLMAGPETGDEYYATGAGDSPLRAALSELPWDSLPPLRVSAGSARGALPALLTHRARRTEERAAVLLSDGSRRVVVVPASGFWRWRMRGGRAADAFDALWGSVFDWVGAVRRDASTERERERIAPEWVPRPPAVASGPVGTAAVLDLTPRAREQWWLFVLAVTALCAEWVLRRRIGWR